MSEAYVAWIETPRGRVIACYDDAKIERIGGLALLLRDLRREGVPIWPSEIAAAAWRREEMEA